MNDYEIRILKPDGTPSLIILEVHLRDTSAIRSARQMANNNAAEVWRGIECIWRSSHRVADLKWNASKRQQRRSAEEAISRL